MAASLEQIALQIKSLEQRTMSVTLPRNASVLDLKQEIQVVFDVESDRQRLIFQGRVLKDDKHLTDYANLDDGKVIHLVIRPAHVPHNPLNDNPNLGANTRYTSNRTLPNERSRIFPSLSSRFPLLEGYTFITLGSSLRGGDEADMSDLPPLLAALSNSAGSSNHERATGSRNNNSASTFDPISFLNNSATHRDRHSRAPFSLSSNRSNQTDFPLPATPSSLLTDIMASDLPFLPSIELRLARTLGSIGNVRALLELSAYNDDDPSVELPNIIPEQLQELRNRLRNSGNTRSTQIGMVLSELADLITDTVPTIRETAQHSRRRNQTVEEQINTRRRIANVSHIAQGMRLINHLLGSVLAATDALSHSSRHSTSRSSSTASSRLSSERLASYIFPRGTTETIRTNTPEPVNTVNPSSSNINNKKTKKSSLSNVASSISTSSEVQNNNSFSSASSSSSSNNGYTSKRKTDRMLEEDEQPNSKKPRNEKGKEKDKKN
ncbi:MAG: hypothetical protein EXX96DRAFT_575923 [Benjaminiella poitrasii]|nr:MAG: hypothetical protein EXX96DRAFT_575923 [Benjaminiella poitrasii]